MKTDICITCINQEVNSDGCKDTVLKAESFGCFNSLFHID